MPLPGDRALATGWSRVRRPGRGGRLVERGGRYVTACYAWPLTLRAGDDLQLHVSTEHPKFGVRLFRYGATVDEVPGQEELHAGLHMPIGRPDEAWGWPRYSIPLPRSLADGLYL